MKRINYLFFCLLLCAAFVVGCKSDDGGDPDPEQTEEEKALAELQGTWDVTTAKRDGTDLEGYSDMTLTISNKNISTSGQTADPSVFPTGSFTFVEGADFKKIDVNGVIVTLAASSDKLTTKFDLNDEGDNASRVLGLAGSYTFTFSKTVD